MNCCICHKEIKGYGNNAAPVVIGTCCNECNNNVVIPFRIYQLGRNQKEALCVSPDHKVKIVKPKRSKFALEELQELVEGYIEFYPTNNKNYFIIVNEEGLMMELKPNHLMSRVFGVNAVGNVVIVPVGLID